MKTRNLIAILAMAVIGSLGTVRSSQAVLYHVNFATPPHTLNQPPAVGGGPAVRETVSEIFSGTPIVVEDHGSLLDQPCLLDSYDGVGDQIRFRLNDLPASSQYQISMMISVTAAQPDGAFSVFVDAPTIRRINFNHDGTIDIYTPHDGTLAGLGAYVLESAVILDIRVDLDIDEWSVDVDGNEIHRGSFGGATAVSQVRVSTPTAGGPGVTGAVDEIYIAENLGVADGPCNRLNFGDQAEGTHYEVGQFLATEGVGISVDSFSETLGACQGSTVAGFAEIVTGQNACGSGKELEVNNVTLDFDFGGLVSEVVIPYGEYGGAVSLGINGDCETVENFIDLDGTSMGGVAISVWDFTVSGQGCGVIRLGGQVSELLIGGQELFLDGISYCTDCPDLTRSAFDDQTLGASFLVGDSFTSGGATHNLMRFFFPGSDCTNPTNNGVATIGNDQFACGGSKEINLNNITDRIDFGGPVQWLVLNYGEYGGNVNLIVNGDCRNLDNFSDINGQDVGGVTVWAVDYGTPGGSCGMLYAVGAINNFRIGGQELYIDNVRVCPVETADVTPPTFEEMQTMLRLDPSWPNPARGGTNLRYALEHSAAVDLSIFDVGGRQVRTLSRGSMDAGVHEVAWDGRDDAGRRLPAGVYTYRLQADGVSSARRLILLP